LSNQNDIDKEESKKYSIDSRNSSINKKNMAKYLYDSSTFMTQKNYDDKKNMSYETNKNNEKNNYNKKKNDDDSKETTGNSAGTSYTNIASALFSSFTFLSQLPKMSYRLLTCRPVQVPSQSEKETAQKSSPLKVHPRSQTSTTPWKDFAGQSEIKPLLKKEK
jgi:hypothetical protein